MVLKFFLCSFVLLLVGTDAYKQDVRFIKYFAEDPVFKEMWIDQNVDHFNFVSHGNQTYKQRYLITEQYMKQGGPIFFYTGNEGNIEGFQKASGFLTDNAPKFEALVVFAEHRYYGKSLPFGDMSFTKENLGLLTIEQALADYAYLLKYLQSKYCSNMPCPVIAFGGSYGGQLAAYMRFKYPDLITGSLAASAPLVWLSGFGEHEHGFFKAVTAQFERSSTLCKTIVKEAFLVTKQWAEIGEYAKISQSFGTCKPVTADTLNHLFEWVRNSFTILAMMNYPYPTNLLGPLPGHPVDAACKELLDAPDVVTGLAAAAGVFYNASKLSCYDIFAEYVECADPTGCGLGNDGIAWDYQACTEINLPGGSTNVTDMFPPLPFTAEIRKNYCESKYGVTPRPEWLDVQFWGPNITSATNIIFSNGNLDPWGPGGFHKSFSNSLIAVEVLGGAHHLDLRGSHADDPPSVISARQQEASIIAEWIKNFDAAHNNKLRYTPH